MSLAEVNRHNETVLDSLEPGDLVEFGRGMYNHWAVYTGNEKVVHRTGVDGPLGSGPEHASSVTGKAYDKAKVREQNFWEVAGDSKAYKNNSRDKIYGHFDSAEIVKRAETQVGDVGYNLLFKNCEHLATGCRYGRDDSGQANGLLFALGTGVIWALGGFASWLGSGGKREREKKSHY